MRHKSARNSPSAASSAVVVTEPDKYSEVATLGDPDEIGSIASLSSINERLIEVRNLFKFFQNFFRTLQNFLSFVFQTF